MIKIEDLIPCVWAVVGVGVGTRVVAYRAPETLIRFYENNSEGSWYITDNRVKISQNYGTLQECLDAYNRSVIPVLPPDTDIIDLHKIE